MIFFKNNVARQDTTGSLLFLQLLWPAKGLQGIKTITSLSSINFLVTPPYHIIILVSFGIDGQRCIRV